MPCLKASKRSSHVIELWREAISDMMGLTEFSRIVPFRQKPIWGRAIIASCVTLLTPSL